MKKVAFYWLSSQFPIAEDFDFSSVGLEFNCILETCLSWREPLVSFDKGIKGSVEDNFPRWPSTAVGGRFGM